MALRPEVKFQSSFPDDTVEDDDDIIEVPGRNIAETLKAAFEQRGYRVSDPTHIEEHGWDLVLKSGDNLNELRVHVIDTDENYIFARNNNSWPWPDKKALRLFLKDLQEILQADDRFSDVGWFPKGRADRVPPASAPFDV